MQGPPPGGPCGVIREDDRRSFGAPMCTGTGTRSLMCTRNRLLFLLLVTGLIVLALGGWAVQGLRWAATGGRARGLPQPA
jgi:hypothetical protein